MQSDCIPRPLESYPCTTSLSSPGHSAQLQLAQPRSSPGAASTASLPRSQDHLIRQLSQLRESCSMVSQCSDHDDEEGADEEEHEEAADDVPWQGRASGCMSTRSPTSSCHVPNTSSNPDPSEQSCWRVWHHEPQLRGESSYVPAAAQLAAMPKLLPRRGSGLRAHFEPPEWVRNHLNRRKSGAASPLLEPTPSPEQLYGEAAWALAATDMTGPSMLRGNASASAASPRLPVAPLAPAASAAAAASAVFDPQTSSLFMPSYRTTPSAPTAPSPASSLSRAPSLGSARKQSRLCRGASASHIDLAPPAWAAGLIGQPSESQQQEQHRSYMNRLSSDTWDSGGGGGGGGGGNGGASLLARSGSSCYAGGASCSKERLLRLAALRSGAAQHPPATPSPVPRRAMCSSALRRSSSEYSTNSVIANTPNSALFSSPSTNGGDWSTHGAPLSMQQNRQAAMAAAAAAAALRYGRSSAEIRTSYKYNGTTANAAAALGYYVPVLTQLDEVVEPGCEEEGAEGGGWQGGYGGGGYDRSSIPEYPDGGVGGEPELPEEEAERGSRNSDMMSPFVAAACYGGCM